MQKSELIQQTYALIRISGLTVDPTPEDLTVALWEMDQMYEEWAGIRRDVNYNFPPPTTGDEMVLSDPSDNLDVFPFAIAGSVASLAVRLVGYFGKEVPDTLARRLKTAMRSIKQNTVAFPGVQYPNRMPRGSGNSYRWYGYNRFYHPSYSGRKPERDIRFTAIVDYTKDFSNFLEEGDTVASYVIEADPQGGIRILTDSRDGNVISYRVEAYRERDGAVAITVTTTLGLVIPTLTCFDTKAELCRTR